jgi:hypothetical protein
MMKKFFNIFLLVLILVLVGFVAHNALAQAPADKTKISTMTDTWISGNVFKSCPKIPIFVWNYFDNSEKARFGQGTIDPRKFDQTSLSHSLVFCADLYIRLASIPFILKYTVLMSQVVSAALVLAIMVFSFKVFMGQANIKSLTFAFFFKIVIVLTVIGSNPFNAVSGANRLISIKETLVHAPREFGGAIVKALYTNENLRNSNTPLPNNTPIQAAEQSYGAIKSVIEAIPGLSDVLKPQNIALPSIPMPSPLPAITLGNLTIDLSLPTFYESGLMFQLFDKHISVVLDLKNIEDLFGSTGQKTTKIGIASIIVGLLFASDITAMVSIVVLIYMVVLISALAQAVLMFITAHLVLTILIAMAPIVMPCLLFTKTEHITKKWFMAIISYSLQPLIFVAFFAFTVVMLDKFATPFSSAVNGNIIAKVYQNSWSKMLNKCTPVAASPACTMPNPSDCPPPVAAVDCSQPGNRTIVNLDMANVLNFFMDRRELDDFKSQIIKAEKAEEIEQTERERVQVSGVEMQAPPSSSDDKVKTSGVIRLDDGLTKEQIAQKLLSGEGVLTSQDFKVYTAYLMAIIILLVILVSFLKFIPDIVEALIGREAPGAIGIAGGVTQPLEQLTNMVDKQSANARGKIKQENQKENQAEINAARSGT